MRYGKLRGLISHEMLARGDRRRCVHQSCSREPTDWPKQPFIFDVFAIQPYELRILMPPPGVTPKPLPLDSWIMPGSREEHKV